MEKVRKSKKRNDLRGEGHLGVECLVKGREVMQKKLDHDVKKAKENRNLEDLWVKIPSLPMGGRKKWKESEG